MAEQEVDFIFADLLFLGIDQSVHGIDQNRSDAGLARHSGLNRHAGPTRHAGLNRHAGPTRHAGLDPVSIFVRHTGLDPVSMGQRWIPACARMTERGVVSRFRGNAGKARMEDVVENRC